LTMIEPNPEIAPLTFCKQNVVINIIQVLGSRSISLIW
jgi:hypothetical protein